MESDKWHFVHHQVPRLRHREVECCEDLEMLEIVSPASFETRIVEPSD